MTFTKPDITPECYWAQWKNSFPADNAFIPIGVFPADESPASLEAVGINFSNPFRNGQQGVWQVTADAITQIEAAGGFYGMGALSVDTCQPSVAASQTTTTAAFSLPADTIPVADISIWANAVDLSQPGGSPSGPNPLLAGQFQVTSSAGVQVITYTGISGSSFTGCTGGTGDVSSGATVGGVDWGSAFAANSWADEADCAAHYYFDGLPADLVAIIDANYDGTCGGVGPAGYKAIGDYLHMQDPTRPVYNQFTSGVGSAYAGGLPDPSQPASATNQWVPYQNPSFADRQEFALAGDIDSFDDYPVNDGDDLAHLGDSISYFRLEASYSRPVSGYVEVGMFSGAVGRAPTPEETVAEVWEELIHGAQYVEYFDGAGSFQVTAGGPMTDAVTAVNAQVTALAPVINDLFATGYIQNDGGTTVVANLQYPAGTNLPIVETMVKFHRGKYYVFAQPRTKGDITVTFTLANGASGTQATSMIGGANVAIAGGKFTDTFTAASDGYSTQVAHVYRID